jgi:general secretion pathway protein M
MMERWQQLAPRERLILGIATALAVVIVGWNYLWSPIRAGTVELRESVAERARLIVDLRRAANLGDTAGSGATAGGDQALVVLVDQTARPLGIATTGTRPGGADTIRVSFRDQEFARLVQWLTLLQTQYGVAASSASISSTGQPGLVTGQIELERG